MVTFLRKIVGGGEDWNQKVIKIEKKQSVDNSWYQALVLRLDFESSCIRGKEEMMDRHSGKFVKE